MKDRLFAITFLVAGACQLLAHQAAGPVARRALTFEDLIALDAVSDPQISPDGTWVAFVVTDYSLEDNRGNSDIWIVPPAGGQARRLTQSPSSDNQPRWSPDSRKLAFVSGRGGSPQVHIMDLAGGEARKISDIATGVANLVWSPDGKWMAFATDLDWPPREEKNKDPYPTEVKIWNELFYRHWDQWRAGKRSHLFVMAADGSNPRDLTPLDNDVPTLALGGYQDIAFTSDSRQIAFVMNPDPVPATGTNNDIFLVPVEGGPFLNLTDKNSANDNNPLPSPDGRWIAYRAQLRPGFESDRHHLLLRDLSSGEIRDLTPDWPLSLGEIAWGPDASAIYCAVEEEARNVLYRISTRDGLRERLSQQGHHQNLRVSSDGSTLVFTRQRAHQPAELHALQLKDGHVSTLSHINAERLAQLEMNPLETFWYPGAMEERVQGLLLKPPFFDASKKYPLIYLIHGGPQGAWQDSFHPRWNYQMFAAPGYVVAMVNFHGSTGYGQDFTDSISQHWGDYPYEDLMRGLDYLLATYSFIDGHKVAAAGASYGGYMINWMAGHTDRFVCLINHDGVFNMESMYGETEELWFPEWEFDGMPWTNRQLYEKWSPHNFAGRFKTPMLVIHGQLDYRVDVSQGFETFTALQRQNVPARFVYFPDEGHWVVQPRNRRVWWREVLNWLRAYLGT